MSKSDPDIRSRILLTDSPADIKLKVRLALTDSVEGITYDLEHRPGVSNLLQILSHARESEETPQELARSFKDSSTRVLKEAVSDSLIAYFREIREKYEYWKNEDHSGLLWEIAKEGAKRANSNSIETMEHVRQLVGLQLDDKNIVL